jgi:S1-C subfamily serine protease
MLSLRSASTYAALALTALLGGALAVGGVALLGGFDDGTTIVTETTPAPRANESRPSPRAGLSINEIYERSASGVVQITAMADPQTSLDPSQIDPFGFGSDPLPQTPSPALGSGFVIDKAGHIVTNYHVVQGGDDIRVSFSNRDTVAAEIVGVDPSTDLAVLEVETSASALTPLPLGDSDEVAVGDQVVAIGNPFGLDRTATAGIVSALQRLITAPNLFTIDHVIQTDAPINKGNSGGPLLNDQAEVIGVNTQIVDTGSVSTGNVGIGFAVPSKTVKDVVAQILRTGRVEHAWLGIRGQPVTEEVAETFNLPVDEGVLVESVLPGSGAAKAELRPGDTEEVVAGDTYVLGGDIIVAVDGEKISTVEDIRDVIAAHKPGQKIKVEIFRDERKSSVTVTLGRQPTSPQG